MTNCCSGVAVSECDPVAELQPWQHHAVASTRLLEAGFDPEGPAAHFPPQRGCSTDISSQHTETTGAFSQAKHAHVGTIQP